MMRKMFSCLLACALLLSLLAVNAGAVSNPNTSKETARTLIPENVATIIATYFLRDAQTIPDNAWSDNTSISNTVTIPKVHPQPNVQSATLSLGRKMNTVEHTQQKSGRTLLKIIVNSEK